MKKTAESSEAPPARSELDDGPANNQQDTNEPGLIAAIDMGSNSFHMIVARDEHGEIRPIERIGEKVQLAAGLDDSHSLDEAALERGYACLKMFAQYIQGLKPEAVRVVGTKALRMAKNRSVFVKQAEHILQRPVEVIAGREEARLIYLGAAHTQADDEGRRLVIDIGGGSTEFIIGERFEPKLMESLHMGCVTYSKTHFKDGLINPENFQSAYYAARLELLNVVQHYRRMGWDAVLGSSGTIKAVEQILLCAGISERGISRSGIDKVRELLMQFQHVDDIELEGLKPDRAAIFPAGLAIISAIFDAFKIKRMEYSDGALREGLLYDMVGRDQHEHVRERTISSLIERYSIDQQHADRVKRHALACFDQVAKSWKLQARERELLSTAARLHELGLAVSHTKYHKHGQYLIKHLDLMGFSPTEKCELAVMVRTHRRRMKAKHFAALPAYREHRVLKLAILLRLSLVLNHIRSEDGLCDYKVSAKGEQIAFSLGQTWLSANPLSAADFKREQAYLEEMGYELILN